MNEESLKELISEHESLDELTLGKIFEDHFKKVERGKFSLLVIQNMLILKEDQSIVVVLELDDRSWTGPSWSKIVQLKWLLMLRVINRKLFVIALKKMNIGA